MQINSINNNTQSFGMACRISSKFGKVIRECTPKQAKQVKILHDALEQAPQDFVLDLSKKGKSFVGLVDSASNSYVTTTPFNYAHCKPVKVVKKTFDDIGRKYSAIAQTSVDKDLTEAIVSKLNIIK